MILDEVFLSLFSSILEQSTNINHVNRRIKALFATCTAEVFGHVFELDPVGSVVYFFFFFTSSGKLQPEDGNQVSAVPLFDSANARILIEKFKGMIWPAA